MVCLTKFSRKSLLNGFFNITPDDDRYERLEQALHRSLTRPDCEADFDLEVDAILNEKEKFVLELCR